MLLPGFGEEGQQKLMQAKVLVIGAGGLGCPALQYLAAAGVGTIGVVDDDTVSLHNLHRQILFGAADIGRNKAEAAAERLRYLNPEIVVLTYPVRLTNQNALELIAGFDLVVDGSDNFSTRYVVNDACILLKKPLVHGAISQYEGQVAVFSGGINYRDLFPLPPQPGSVPNCGEAGVLGVLPGIIGSLQAAEAIKLLAGLGRPLINRLFTYHALTNESFVFELAPALGTDAFLPTSAEAFRTHDYAAWCGDSAGMASEIGPQQFAGFFQNKNALLIDVREANELPEGGAFPHQKIPLSLLRTEVPAISAAVVVVFCQSGKRSQEAATILRAKYGDSKTIYSLRGGLLNWKQNGKEA